MPKFSPTQGQEFAIDFALKAKYSILAMKPGQGKTLCAVEIMRRKGLNMLVVCPGYGRGEWSFTIAKQCPEKEIISIKKRADLYRPTGNEAIIVSYEMLYDPKQNPKDKITRELFLWADIVVFDECQYLKSMTSKRSYYAHKLVYETEVPYLMLLTGTPIKNRIEELYSLVSLCHYKFENSKFHKVFPKWHRFAEFFSHPREKRIKTKRGIITQVVYEGTRNLDKLKEYTEWCYFTMPKHLEFKNKEKIIRNVLADRVKDSPDLEKSFLEFVNNNKSTQPTEKKQAALETASFSGSLALELSKEYGQIVIFTDHQGSSEKIAKKLKVPHIHGGVNVKKRIDIMEKFKAGEYKFIVATYGTLSTAISLVNSNVMVLNDPPWVPGDLEQTMARIDRKGQDRQCIYYRVIATKQSEKIYDILERKQKTIDKLSLINTEEI